jgi:uncharacterized protein
MNKKLYQLSIQLPLKTFNTTYEEELKRLISHDFQIIKRSIDARKKDELKIIVTLKAKLNQKDFKILRNLKQVDRIVVYQEKNSPEFLPKSKASIKPLIIGTGPAGIFCALHLLRSGLTSTILEQGDPVEERLKKVTDFWKLGLLDEKSNVQFGEGGAGTFSDGKLTTSKNNLYIPYVLKQFEKFGAPKEILYEAKPHLGTDQLQNILKNIRKYLIDQGCELRFNSEVTDLSIKNSNIAELTINSTEIIPAELVIMAIGNSSRKLFRLLHNKDIPLQAKRFAVGFRVEHPQALINEIQYGKFSEHPALPPASYKLTFNKDDHGVYSFCMCPGGQVIAASSEKERLVVNGMSNFNRASGYANSALVVSVDEKVLNSVEGPDALKGLVFQELLEEKTFKLGDDKYSAPAQRITSYLKNVTDQDMPESTYRPGVLPQDLNQLLPADLNSLLKEGLNNFDRKMKGFITNEALLIGTETRTSSPLTIIRTPEGTSPALDNLYPCGEGSGYAGGIMSASLDGIKTAEKILQKFSN